MVTVVVEAVPTVTSGKQVPLILISKSSLISKIVSSVAVTLTQSDPSVGIGPGGIVMFVLPNDKSSPAPVKILELKLKLGYKILMFAE